jgi:outer membrane lipoprotein carrier protein
MDKHASILTLAALAWLLLTAVPAETAPLVTSTTMTVPTASDGDVIRTIEDRYRNLTDLTAKVVQKNFLASVGTTQRFDAELSIKRPGRLRLEYTNGQLIVIDGTKAWFYSKKNEQAIRRTFKDFEQANIPVAFLLGASDIRSEFQVIIPEPDKPRMLDLLPKKSGAAMKKIRIYADERGRITRMTIADKSGNSSDVIFSEIKEGVGLEDGLFQFMVPKGTEIIEQ